MAEKFLMKNAQTGETKQGILGFSWTTLFFGFIPALCRGDFQTAFLIFGLDVALFFAAPNFIFYFIICNLPQFIYAFFYNQVYTQNLVDKGFYFAESEERNNNAKFLLTRPKTGRIIFCSIYTVLCVFIAFAISKDMPVGNPVLGEIKSKNVEKSNATVDLLNQQSSNISPYGRLADIFNLPSDSTDLQREETLKDVSGKIVEWELPVYEISKESSELYKIIISQGKNVGCIVYISAKTEEDRVHLLSLKTGSLVSFKGQISGDTFMRSIIIKPAILTSLNRSGDSSNLNKNYSATNSSSGGSNSNSSLQKIIGIVDCGRDTCQVGDFTLVLNDFNNFTCNQHDLCYIEGTTKNNNLMTIKKCTTLIKMETSYEGINGIIGQTKGKFVGCKTIENIFMMYNFRSMSGIEYSLGDTNYGDFEMLCQMLMVGKNYNIWVIQDDTLRDEDGNFIKTVVRPYKFQQID